MKKRTEGKIKNCIALKDSYKYYKENADRPVDYKTYVKYIKECNTELLNQVVNESVDVLLPYRIGTLHVVKFDRDYSGSTKNWPVDFKRTKELGFKVYFDQEAVYKWRWAKTHSIVKNKNKYKFTASRKAKRMVPQALANKVDYFKI